MYCLISLFQKLRTPYDIALAKGLFELAETLDGHLTAEEARKFYLNRIGAIYGVSLICFYKKPYSVLLKDTIQCLWWVVLQTL